MQDIKEIIGVSNKFVLGMVHCLPLPGTALFGGDCSRVYEQAIQDARILAECGVDAVIVENMGDAPFAEKLDTAQITALTISAAKVRAEIGIPVGIDAAFNDYEAALAIAIAADCQFIRVPVFVDTVEFYGGIINPCARDCIAYRKQLNHENVMILADLQVKHTNMLLPHVTIESSAINAEACLADALIVTGSSIGQETPLELIERVKKVVSIPVIAGSGVNDTNIAKQLTIADGAIIGSSLKKDGVLSNPISEERVKNMLTALRN